MRPRSAQRTQRKEISDWEIFYFFVTFASLVVKDIFSPLETNQISNQLQAHNGTIFAAASIHPETRHCHSESFGKLRIASAKNLPEPLESRDSSSSRGTPQNDNRKVGFWMDIRQRRATLLTRLGKVRILILRGKTVKISVHFS